MLSTYYMFIKEIFYQFLAVPLLRQQANTRISDNQARKKRISRYDGVLAAINTKNIQILALQSLKKYATKQNVSADKCG